MWIWAELARSPGGGHGDPLQYTCLEDPTDTGASWATAHSVINSWTQLKRLSMHACVYIYIYVYIHTCTHKYF